MVRIVRLMYRGQIAVTLKFILLIQQITHQLYRIIWSVFFIRVLMKINGTFEYVYKNSSGYIILIETYNGHDFRNKSSSYETYITIFESEIHLTDYNIYEYQPASYSGYIIRDGVTLNMHLVCLISPLLGINLDIINASFT